MRDGGLHETAGFGVFFFAFFSRTMEFLPGTIKEKRQALPASFPPAARQGTEREPGGAEHDLHTARQKENKGWDVQTRA